MEAWLRIAAAAVTMFSAVGTASAQSPFPSRPVHIFVPYAAGGGVDILARTLGDVVSRHWGQTVVIENRPGAGGVVASQALATSQPDGYTLIVVASGHATNPFLYPKIPYNTFSDFVPISLLASSPNILLVRADSPFRTLGDMIAQARAKPGSLSFAHAGTGTSTHLAGELLKNLARIDINAIPYKGGAPAINDLVGGQVHAIFEGQVVLLPHLKSGRVRALAITGMKRDPALPDVPTFVEAGLPRYDAYFWSGLVAPGGTPAEVIAKLNSVLVRALNAPDAHDALMRQGLEPAGTTPQQFAAFIAAEVERWGQVAKASGAKLD